jgi:hypothetical protein
MTQFNWPSPGQGSLAEANRTHPEGCSMSNSTIRIPVLTYSGTNTYAKHCAKWTRHWTLIVLFTYLLWSSHVFVMVAIRVPDLSPYDVMSCLMETFLSQSSCNATNPNNVDEDVDKSYHVVFIHFFPLPFWQSTSNTFPSKAAMNFACKIFLFGA